MKEPAGFMKEPAGFVAFSEAHASEAHVPFFQIMSLGFRRGVPTPCAFYHLDRKRRVVVHGGVTLRCAELLHPLIRTR